MEYIWYILAALGAGIGTGLAGLSAATVMVPILIVFCPSFSGENGAYQATAIALASDILGSAVTTITYGKHKNIDLKRGWIMLTCILTMSTVGSYAAWLAGNVVLGSFTLFLTFFIGIRFLVKPDTSRENTVDKGEQLDWKGVAISFFFGLTIGFGTGFVGTGGGMMMLVVFTAFLGMELKTAVGTSTFIMTFTAIIASVSHIIIHPAIILERFNVMLLCIIVATVASLVSAQFANRVKSRTVGLVTGVVLTVLGGAMLILNYWSILSQITIIATILQCLILNLMMPFIMILVGYILKKHPITDMHSNNGYNTPTSKKSQAHWDYAQSIAPDIFIRLGKILGIAELILNILLSILKVPVDSSIIIGIIIGFIFLFWSFYKIETKIKDKFANN